MAREEGGRHVVVQGSGSGNAEQKMKHSDSQAAALIESGDTGMWVVREREVAFWDLHRYLSHIPVLL